ncbi:MAG: aldo/keto reductase [Frankiaceae bacterium]
MTTPMATLSSGRQMPLLGLGTWQLRGRQAYAAVRDALEVGYRHFDTATVYGNEREVGRAIRDSGVPRDAVFVTTKLPPEHADRPRRTLQDSLGALGFDAVDLWLVHWPPRGGAAPELWAEFLAARKDGLARAIGVSNYSTSQIDALIAATGVPPEVNQIRWGPSLYDPGRAAELQRRGIVLEGYSPFKSSDLSDPTLRAVASSHEITVAQVIVRWHLQHGFSVIPKSAQRERIDTNFDVFSFTLTNDEMGSIDG